MTVWAVHAAAGYGKTYRLMEKLRETLVDHPLVERQRILALTFMHGSRRRLDERLRSVSELAGRYLCITIDSLAWRLRQRWRSLGEVIGLPNPGLGLSFEIECELAAQLLSNPSVLRWLAASFPVVLVDEAQDLTRARLAMIASLGSAARLFLAADEFQCLDPKLRPNPLAEWLPKVCTPESLPMPRRTNVQALLEAATAIRSNAVPVASGRFKIMPGPSLPLASAQLASAIAWRKGGSVAVITPSTRGDYVRGAVRQVHERPCGKNKDLGPFPIRWEQSDLDELTELESKLELPDKCTVDAALEVLGTISRSGPVKQTMDSLKRTANTTGRGETTAAEVMERLARYVNLRRHHSARSDGDLLAMTVHQAKNREFDGVVVMWPYTVKADDEGKRRLLYNAVTRARRWCTVIVQSKDMLNAAPFA